MQDPEKAIAPVIRRMSSSDQEVAARPAVREILPGIFAEAYRRGPEGPAWELTVLARPWGFDPSQIRMPVTLWQGEDDRNVPVEWGRYFATTLPNCTAHFLPSEGHLLIFDHWDEILAEVLS
jgi:pimeloyl-ACP methyl ester carboxylesterase